ncbi:hypothetical protein Tco_0256918 [Tanacetum coccineum]
MRKRTKFQKGPDRFSLLTKTLKEVFALEKGKFKAPPPMITPAEKGIQTSKLFRNSSKEYNIFDKPKAHKKGNDQKRQAPSHLDDSTMGEGEEDGTEGPMIIEAEIGGHFVHRIYVDGGAISEIQWRNHLADRPDIPTSKDRTGIRKIRVVPSITHGMLKFPVKGGTVTIYDAARSSLIECDMLSGPNTQHPVTSQVLEEKIKVVIHPEYPEQTIAIGSTLTEKGHKELCALLRQNLDIFASKPADMTSIPRHIVEHRLNVREGYLPIRQKKRGQAPERNKAIQGEVENW